MLPRGSSASRLRNSDGSVVEGYGPAVPARGEDYVAGLVLSEDVSGDGSVEVALSVAQGNAPKIMDELVRTSLSKTLPAETKIKASTVVLSYALGLPGKGQTLEARKMSKRGLMEELEKLLTKGVSDEDGDA